MSYLQFHLCFIFPAILFAALWGDKKIKPSDYLVLGMIAVIALAYTFIWDKHLIEKGVWTYPVGVVIGAFQRIPYEELAFMLLQPFLVGLAFITLSDLPEQPDSTRPIIPGIFEWSCFGFCLMIAYGGYQLMGQASYYYLGIILAWAVPMVGLQQLWGASEIFAVLRRFPLAFLVPTLYLCLADAFAISQGIWSIAPAFSTGLKLGVLPVEEILFFTVTDLLVIQGLICYRCRSFSPRLSFDPSGAVSPQ